MNKVLFCATALVLAVNAAGQFVTVKQDPTAGDYPTIQAALDDTMREFDEIVVYPGRYEENLTIRGNVTLRAYEGPYLTCIDGNQEPSQAAVYVQPNVPNVEIIGFTVTRGVYGISVATSSEVLIANCVAYQNTSHGFYTAWDRSSTLTNVKIYNCVSKDNSGSGYYMTAGAHYDNRYSHLISIYNSIIVYNGQKGIEYNAGLELNDEERFILDSNCIEGNVGGNFGTNLGPGSNVPVLRPVDGPPGFIGEESEIGTDVRLAADSAMRDNGREGTSWLDPDGTRNDLGAYGGPYALSFFESPMDGPIVREVRVSPGSVLRGEEITIEATVAVR